MFITVVSTSMLEVSLCILDQEGNVLVHRKLPCDPEQLLKALDPYREDLAVAVECLFCWLSKNTAPTERLLLDNRGPHKGWEFGFLYSTFPLRLIISEA